MRHLLLIFLAFANSGMADDAWGAAVGGIRLGAAIVPAGLRITVQNSGDEPVLVPLGALIGAHQYDWRFETVLIMRSGEPRRVICTVGPAGVAGRVDPLVVPLPPNTSYSVEIPLSKFFVLDGSEPLDRFLGLHPCRMRVELDIQNPRCPAYGGGNPNMIRCWQGKVVSNLIGIAN